VFASKTSLPIAVFLFAVVLDFNAHKPTAVLRVPVVLAASEQKPTAVLFFLCLLYRLSLNLGFHQVVVLYHLQHLIIHLEQLSKQNHCKILIRCQLY
jgi:hypothetical protein